MTDLAPEARHEKPFWQEKANFIIGAEISDWQPGQYQTEQLWVRQVDRFRFEVCSIPFFLYDVALGDVVETDEQYNLRRVVSKSGRLVFRALLHWDDHESHLEMEELLREHRANYEWQSKRLISMDVETAESGSNLSGSLAQLVALNWLDEYETGATK